MISAKVLRAIARDRVVVLLLPHGSVVELEIDPILSQEEFARCAVLNPYHPASAMVTPGEYHNNVYRGSVLAGLAFPPPPPRRRVDYSKRRRGE